MNVGPAGVPILDCEIAKFVHLEVLTISLLGKSARPPSAKALSTMAMVPVSVSVPTAMAMVSAGRCPQVSSQISGRLRVCATRRREVPSDRWLGARCWDQKPGLGCVAVRGSRPDCLFGGQIFGMRDFHWTRWTRVFVGFVLVSAGWPTWEGWGLFALVWVGVLGVLGRPEVSGLSG